MDDNKIAELIVHLFSLSISAHNVQPFKLKVMANKSFKILCDEKRLLPFADPHNRDLLIALGALIETLEIGLSRNKLRLIVDEINDKAIPSGELAHLRVESDESMRADELVDYLEKRFSFRGKFDRQVDINVDTSSTNLMVLKDSVSKELIAKHFDYVNLKFLTSKGYIDELYSWMRFKKSNSLYYKDGLNPEAMSLNAIDSLGASLVLKPKVFKSLNSLKILPYLITEAPIIQSSSAIVAIVGDVTHKDDPVSIGRGFMRGWLTLTSAELYGAPLSLLTDDMGTLESVKTIFNLPSHKMIYNVLRVGPLPLNFKIPRRARLAKEDIYV